MPTVEWDIPFTISTPRGLLFLNQDIGNGRQFMVNPEKSVARRGLRVITDPIPQGDGEIFHDRYANGYEMQFAVQLWNANEEIACNQDLVEMRDELYGHLWSILRPVGIDGGAVIWTPSGLANRRLSAVRLLALADPDIGEGGVTEITFTVDSPFPYAISNDETVFLLTSIDILPNDGNIEFYPVAKVAGPTDGFTITDNETGDKYVYDGNRPGAQNIASGEYAEIDMFRGGLIYLNGDEDNLKPGIDVEESSILVVAPGGSSYTITGADADFLLHDAFA
jgi:hypothetical protein